MPLPSKPRRCLHILTSDDPFPSRLAQLQAADPGTEPEVIDLTQTHPDYEALVRKIFEADAVAVWT